MCHTGEVSNVQQVVVLCRGSEMGLGGCFVVCVYMAAFGLSQVRTLHHAKHQVDITIAGTVASATTKQIELPATSGRSNKPDGPGYADGDASDASGEENADEPPPTAACRYHVTTKNACTTWGASKGLFTFAIDAKTNLHNFTHQRRLPFRVYRLQFMLPQDQTRSTTPSSACCCRKNKDTSTSFNPGSCVWRRNGFERSTATIFTLAGPEPMKV